MNTLVSNNVTIKINSAASATTLTSTQYAVCTYIVGTLGTGIGSATVEPCITAYYGPGDTITSTITATLNAAGGATATTYNFRGGVIFSNTP